MRKIVLITVLAFICLFATELLAQTPSPSPVETSSSAAGPVAVPEPSEKAMSYYHSGIVFWAVNTALGAIIPFLFLQTGLSAKIRDLAGRIGRKWFFTVIIYFLIFSLLNFLITLPIDFYLGFIRQHDYGLSNQTFAKWLSDTMTSLLIGLIGGGLLISIPYLFLRRSPRRWWLYTSILLVPFYCFVILITPIVIDPLFNNFGEMKDKQLETKILALADRAGIEGSRVFEVDKSADTNAVNAYVTGFMHTKRIVLWDTIIRKLDTDELLVVMGHEMGHFVLGHVYQGLIFASIGTFFMLYLVYRISGFLTDRFGTRWGFNELSDPAALPLILLVVGVLSFVFSPISNAVVRHAEHEADRFALELTHDNHGCGTAFVKLQTENLSNPRPNFLIKILRYDHPTIGERIDFCNEYRPWETGEPQSYNTLFK